jgi:RNA polymerase sigma-70 factor (sigma-E family)
MEPLRALGSHSYVSDPTRAVEVPDVQATGAEDFNAFYRRRYATSVRLAWLLTGSRAAAEDVVQDAMAAVYGRFDAIALPEAYLRRAIVNRAKSRQRDERRQRERIALVSGEPGALDQGDAELLDLVRRLPYRQRVVIVARYWGDWPEAEIALALGCRPGTVKSLASRALDRLRMEVQQ